MILLDTHIYLWWLFDDPKLPDTFRTLISNPDNEVFVSAASVWEIATKFRLGKLPEATAVAKDIPAWIRKAGFLPMPIMPEHAQLAGSWEIAHRDPFDRMLAAQAKLAGTPLATMDKAFDGFPIETLNY
jgi:PIN domain nuclease of toxin-antitoxin system